MAGRYTAGVSTRQSLPLLWLLSDPRNDGALETALAALPRGCGFVFRHYHLDGAARAARFGNLAGAAKASGHLTILADDAALAREWGADGVYGAATRIASARDMVKLATAHNEDQLALAGRVGADGVFLSPVFPTRSHPGAPALGIRGFHALARQSPVPVIALGGMTKARAAALAWPRWGAVDGLVSPQPA